MNNELQLLDCTLRDGGYYTNWDFPESLVDSYLETLEELPIEYIELGYRNEDLKGYFGEFYYCPLSTLAKVKKLSSKKIAIILNEREMSPKRITSLLEPIKPFVTLVRMAIDPINFTRAIEHAKVVKELGFEVGFNVMYMSKWGEYPEIYKSLSKLDGIVDYFYMVDSFGSVMPEDVVNTINEIKKASRVKIGFHGHNNMELALINTITAVNHGATIIDSTISGMGRGAGNLSTELLMVYLTSQKEIPVEFTKLASLSESFDELKTKYKWGTSLPYMVSGAFSLAQKDVMSWIGQGFYSVNSIMNALKNKSQGVSDNYKLPVVTPPCDLNKIVLIGGGNSVKKSITSILDFIKSDPTLIVIHVGSRHLNYFDDITNSQIVCMIGDEAMRLDKKSQIESLIMCVYPKFPRKMGTILSAKWLDISFELDANVLFDSYEHSALQVALNLAGQGNCRNIYSVGFDGYDLSSGDVNEVEVFRENLSLFEKYKALFDTQIVSLTPTTYEVLEKKSIFELI